jgi:Fic-DOC domain mobile mystery protein B
MRFEYQKGATPLDQDEIDGLIPSHIALQSELNEWEEVNILRAETWVFSKTSHGNFLTIDFLKLLHRKMFEDTWKWAGFFRSTEKSIGIAPFYITTQTQNLLDDVYYQITHLTLDDIDTYNTDIDDIACRFHHRLVAIHPFPNGNGRHARLMTDLLLVQAGRPRFSWGDKNLAAKSTIRDRYIAALKNADKLDYTELTAFVRS